MYETPFRATEAPNDHHCDGRCRRRGAGVIGTAMFWVGVALLAMMAFGAVSWAFGLVFHLLGLLVRLALVTAVVALVWRRFSRRRHRPAGP